MNREEERKLYKAVRDWLPFDKIYEDGIIKLKDEVYVKVIKVSPINFNLKSNFEKEAILNSYKLFLKTCNFDIQILIQSNKKNIEKNIEKIKKNSEKESNKLKKIINEYCNSINKINSKNKSSSKNFYIIIKKYSEKNDIDLIKEELNNNYFKIKECLLRCGNNTYNVITKEEIKEIIYNFLNKKI